MYMDKVQHFEIPADDIARARKFYEGTFGWNTAEWPMPGGEMYIGLRTGPVNEKMMPAEPGYIGGGMFKRKADLPVSSPTIAITVDDINASLEKIKSAGGKILGEVQTVGDMGLYAYAQDTEGNVIGIWQNLKKS